MYVAQPKKVAILAILEILNKYTDATHMEFEEPEEAHTLTAKEIEEKLETDYDIKLERKAIKRNLMDLIALGYDIEFKEIPKKSKSEDEESIYTDWYINHKFNNSELRLLIDSLLFSKHIPYNQCKKLIEKLTGLSSMYFKANVQHVYNLPENLPENKQLFYTINDLDDAIHRKKQVEFNYTEYGTDFEKRIKLDSNGDPVIYKVNPYQMVAANGRYYLVCNLDKYDDLANYRVDRIMNIKVLKSPAKSIKNVKGGKNGLDLPKHMAEHIYMYTGEGERVTFLAHRSIFTDLIDWFGKDFKILDNGGDTIEVIVTVNKNAMFNWALQYGPRVEVLKPEDLRGWLAKETAEMAEKYSKPGL